MTYATRRDMEDRFGAQEVEDLLAAPRAIDAGGDAVPDDPAAAANARLDAALADAAAEIDAALAPVFAVPLPAGRWPRLTGIACDLARRRLYDDSASEIVTERARSARAALKRLAGGGETLLDAAGAPAPGRRNGARSVRTGPEPAMTPDNLAGL